MKVRILQRKDDEGWYDDAYTLEDEAGRVTLHHNLTWERVGLTYTKKIQETSISLAHIEQVIQPTEHLRWLPVQLIEGKVEEFLEDLNRRCAIPEPRVITKPVIA